jgi:hypothetical protein
MDCGIESGTIYIPKAKDKKFNMHKHGSRNTLTLAMSVLKTAGEFMFSFGLNVKYFMNR